MLSADPANNQHEREYNNNQQQAFQPQQPTASMQVPPAPSVPQAPVSEAIDHAQEIADQAASSFNDQQ